MLKHDDDLIVVRYGDPVLDFGVGTLPKLFSRFYCHLTCTYLHHGQTVVETLSDAEAWLIAQVLLLKSDQDFVLRLSNLPLASSPRSRAEYLGKLRRMGLVFTTRLYYTRAELVALFGPEHLPATPRQYAQQWDFTALFHNLALIGQEYLARQQAAVQSWQASGSSGARPVVTLPEDYQHEIQLPPTVARRIVAGEYDPRPLSSADGDDKRGPRWADLAVSLAATAPDAPTQKPSVRFEFAPAVTLKAPVRVAHRRQKRQSSIDDDVVVDGETGKELTAQAVFEHFARRKAVAYAPTGRDRKALASLLQAGYTFEQIRAGIDAVFERGDDPQRFTYCASAIQDQSPARPPADPAPAVARVSAPAEDTVAVPPELQAAADLCRAAGLTLTGEVITRLRLLAENCASAAQQHQTTGPAWLTEALQRSVGRANVDVLAYAEAILQTWIEHGPHADLRPRREGYRPAAKAQPPPDTVPPKRGRQRRDFEAEVRDGGPA